MNCVRNDFHKAAAALIERYGNARISQFVVDGIINGQRFVMPDAGEMTDGKRISDYSDALKNLPFPKVALLREHPQSGEQDSGAVWQIIVAVAAEATDYCVGASCDWWIAECVYFGALSKLKGEEIWVPSRPWGMKYSEAEGGVVFFDHAGSEAEERALVGYASEHEPRGAFNGLCELLVMLSLSNVGTKRVDPPKFLNRKRVQRGKLPLYDYHVLTIDGAEVYGRESSASDDRRIRSHFRRGHIRRLDDSRRVWVRASYVHGRADGFVDKDYKVVTPHHAA